MHTCKHIFVETLSCCETFEWTWLEPIYLLRYTVSPWFMTLFWNLEKVRKFIDNCSSCIAPSFHMCWTKSWRVTLYSHPINGLLPSLVVENFSKKHSGPSHLSWFATSQLTIHPINFRRQSRSADKSPQKVGYSRDFIPKLCECNRAFLGVFTIWHPCVHGPFSKRGGPCWWDPFFQKNSQFWSLPRCTIVAWHHYQFNHFQASLCKDRYAIYVRSFNVAISKILCGEPGAFGGICSRSILQAEIQTLFLQICFAVFTAIAWQINWIWYWWHAMTYFFQCLNTQRCSSSIFVNVIIQHALHRTLQVQQNLQSEFKAHQLLHHLLHLGRC